MSVMTRYRDAYLVARATIYIGSMIKRFGILVAVLILVATMAASNQAYGDQKLAIGFIGFIVSVILGGVFYLLGILVSAQGQLLQASLDSAVNGSPFLTDDQRARVMSL